MEAAGVISDTVVLSRWWWLPGVSERYEDWSGAKRPERRFIYTPFIVENFSLFSMAGEGDAGSLSSGCAL